MPAAIKRFLSHAMILVAGVASLFSLSACVTSRQIAEQTAELNRGQEEAHNAIVLLNVIRAYQRRPMHFMRISTLRGSLNPVSGSLGLALPIGGDANVAYTPTSTFGLARPTFDTQVLDSQEFMRGITTPIPPATMLYYLDQGWPQQMVLMLFVRSIETYTLQGDQTVLTDRISNYAQNPTELGRFQNFMTSLKNCEIELVTQTTREPFGPPIAAAGVADASALVAAKSADLQLVATDAKGEPTQAANATHYRLFQVQRRSLLQLSNKPREGLCSVQDGARSVELKQQEGNKAGSPAPSGKPTNTSIAFVLRSPEAMIYYLGEIARAQLQGSADGEGGANHESIAVRISYGALRDPDNRIGPQVRLFTLNRGGDAKVPAGARVEYDGQTYSLPPSSTYDRSMHTLSLISQLLMLQNKGAELPNTTSVRIIP